MQFAQILVTDDQALKARLAIDLVLQDPERYVMEDDERRDFERLAVFFGHVATNPSSFPPTGRMAKTVKSIVRRAKGPAQPPTGRKKRSQGQQKRDRAARREFVEQYNAAVEQYEKERQEMEARERELAEKYANEPRVQVLRADGVPILTDVPASMVVPMPSAAEQFIETNAPGLPINPADELGPRIVLPGNVERQMEREAQA